MMREAGPIQRTSDDPRFSISELEPRSQTEADPEGVLHTGVL